MTGGPNARILVVDDDEAMRELLCDVLAEDGFEVVSAPNGAVALRVLFEDPRGADVVITDHKMPVTTGIELAQRIRMSLGWTPVVVVSAFADDTMRARAQCAGVSAVFPKPFQVNAFLDVVRRLVPIGV